MLTTIRCQHCGRPAIPDVAPVLCAGDVHLDLGQMRLLAAGFDLTGELPLPAVRILGVMLRRPGVLFSASTIGTATLLSVDSVITLVCRARRALRDVDSQVTIRTVRGLEDGPHYSLEVDKNAHEVERAHAGSV